MVALSAAALDGIPAASNPPAPLVWVLHDGKAGMASQALGLAEATGFPFVEKRLSVRRPWAWLPPQLWLTPLRAVSEAGVALTPPWPDLVIGCGRHTAMPALAIRRASGGHAFAAQIQDPRVGRDEFDLLFVPEHDHLRGPRIQVTRGALHRVTPARLAAELRRFPALAGLPRPVLGVLIGGSNRSYRLGLDRLATIADAIAGILRGGGGSAVVTPSRRTGAAGVALLRQRLAGLPAEIWDGAGDNPYYAYLAAADALLVTADSVSMVSEAAATGKPVHILELAGGDAKFARFHKAMREAGITRPFAGRIESWSYVAPDDTARAGALLRDSVLARLDQRRHG
jgi:mitochondrial fission protein ELM1